MTTKYQGLPDIDTAPDVFETSDEPEAALRPSDGGPGDDEVIIKPHSELIDASGLPARRKAERVFGRGTKKDASGLSFRPRLPPLHRHRASSSSSDEEITSKETPAARIRRLKAELAQVESELQAESSRPRIASSGGEDVPGKRRSVLPPKDPIDLVGELAGLRERLTAVEMGDRPRFDVGGSGDLRQRLERLNEPLQAGMGAVTDEVSVEKGEKVGLSELDKRLAMLEDLVGPSDPAFDSSSPLVTTINKHDHLLTLLTQPRHLDAISRRVKLLLVDLDRAAAASRRQPAGAASNPSPGDKSVTLSTTDHASLQTLFALLPRLDPLLPIVPPLLARLQSLSGLHGAASEVADGLSKLKESEKKGGEEVKELQSVVEGVLRGLNDAGKAVVANWDGLEKRMKELEVRVKALDQ